MDCMWATEASGGAGLDAMALSMESSRARKSLVCLPAIAGIKENVLYIALVCFGNTKTPMTVKKQSWY